MGRAQSVEACACGGVPVVSVYRVPGGGTGARARCSGCGLPGPEVQHAWGGDEARDWALEKWNDMRQGAS